MADHWLIILLCYLLALSAQVHGYGYVNITYVKDASAKGAVCLDGSPAAYTLSPGSGAGADNWLVYLEGGGWCNNKTSCIQRVHELNVGSSVQRPKNRAFNTGLLDNVQAFNPDFYNWNIIKVIQCDGGGFMGDVEEVDTTSGLSYRGMRIFNVVMEELLARGMKNAKNAVLVGGSAGGLAALMHCDGFRELIPNAERVKCISDSGFFLHARNLPGAYMREAYYGDVIQLHGIEKFLPKSCTSRMSPALCFFPENFVRDIQTPLFFIESDFDMWQMENKFIPFFGGAEAWANCLVNATIVENLTLCTDDQLQQLKEYRATAIETLQELGNSADRGILIHSCYYHGHVDLSYRWRCPCVVGNKSLVEVVGDWYFDRGYTPQITQDNMPKSCTPLSAQEVDSICVFH